MDEINYWWPLIGLAMMRPIGLMLMVPLFSNAILGGALIRNSLALIASIPVLPMLTTTYINIPSPIDEPIGYILLLTIELSIGLILGFSAAIPFWAVDMAGFIIDTMRGASMAGIYNPLMGAQSSPLGTFFSQIMAVIFMSVGGLQCLLYTLYDSYRLLPPKEISIWSNGFIPMLLQEWQYLYTLMLKFSMPSMIIMVLIDLALGLINRSAQQMNVFVLSMPIKSGVVLLMLIIGIPYQFAEIIERIVDKNINLLSALKALP